MRRLLLLLPFLALSGWAANPAYVGSLGSFSLSTAGTTQTDTLTSTSTAGNDVIVGLTLKNTASTVSSVTATGAVFLPYVGETANGTNQFPTIWVCHKCAAISSITVTISASSVFQTQVEQYSGVTSYGQASFASGSSTAPAVTITTQDANNFIVAVLADLGNAGIPTSNTGTIRDSGRTGTTSSHVGSAFCDNSAASSGTAVTCQVTITSGQWSAIGLELRSATSPMTDHVGSYGANDATDSSATSEQDFLIPVSPEPALSGNLGVCWATWAGGTTAPTVTDDKSDTVVKVNEVDDASNLDVALWSIALSSGARLVKFHFSSALASGAVFVATCSQFNNASTTTDGTCGAATITTGPNLTCGSMTTTAADIIYVVASIDTGNGPISSGTGMGPCREGQGHTILIPHNVTGYCSEYTVTAGSGSPNPGIYFGEWASGANGTTTNQYNIIGAAFKIAAGGTAPSGMRIAREWQPAQGAVTNYFNCPSTGNFMSGVISNSSAVYTIKDSNQVTWSTNAFQGRLNYSVNSTLDPSSMCSVANTDAGNDEVMFRDIYGTATSGTIVLPTACPSPSTLENSGSNIQCFNGTMTGTTTQTDGPDLTPANSGDLILDEATLGTGPTLACTNVTNCRYDCGTYTGQSDASGMCFGEGHQHYYTTSTSTLNFGWTMGSGATAGSAGAWEIKAAPAPPPGGCAISLLGVGKC